MGLGVSLRGQAGLSAPLAPAAGRAVAGRGGEGPRGWDGPFVSPGVCCFAWVPQFRGAMVCRGALGYVAFPARSGKYLPAGRTGGVGRNRVAGVVGSRVGGLRLG